VKNEKSNSLTVHTVNVNIQPSLCL